MLDKMWDTKNGKFIERIKRVDDFFDEVEAVCKKYGYSISHEDYHGAFVIQKFEQDNIEWLTI
jgi:FAD/FMN-containing dehydrogenase